MSLPLWNRWRHETYKDNREAELIYLNELPAAPTVTADKGSKEKAPPEVKNHFTLAFTQPHTYGGDGKLAGKTDTAYFYHCNKDGCTHSKGRRTVKQVGTGTGQLFGHLDKCQPVLANSLRVGSKHSHSQVDEETGEEYSLFNFEEAQERSTLEGNIGP